MKIDIDNITDFDLDDKEESDDSIDRSPYLILDDVVDEDSNSKLEHVEISIRTEKEIIEISD